MSSGNNFFRTETNLAAEAERKRKAERTKHLGDPLDLPAKPLDVIVSGSDIWLAQSDAVVRRIDMESGETRQVYKGHTAPVTSIALLEVSGRSNGKTLLVSGSWDKTVKIWNTEEKSVISSTNAHTDFVKCVFSIPEPKLLVTSGSDKVVRFWDASDPSNRDPLRNIGAVSAHSRPVQSIAVETLSSTVAILYTADTMGIIKIWQLDRTFGDSPYCRATESRQLSVHRTGINDMRLGKGQLWTASSDETVLLTGQPASESNTTIVKPIPAITHPTAVRALLPLSLTEVDEPYLLTAAGDVIYLYDIGEPSSPELVSTTDAHFLDIIALRLWLRRKVSEDGKYTVEPWIISASLDQTVRRWRLAELVSPHKEPPEEKEKEDPISIPAGAELTEEEEEELAELLNDGQCGPTWQY